MVDVKALIDSLGRISWKAGNVTGKVSHQVDADGTHRIVITVPKKAAAADADEEVGRPHAPL